MRTERAKELATQTINHWKGGEEFVKSHNGATDVKFNNNHSNNDMKKESSTS